jgi:hypothetical protein
MICYLAKRRVVATSARDSESESPHTPGTHARRTSGGSPRRSSPRSSSPSPPRPSLSFLFFLVFFSHSHCSASPGSDPGVGTHSPLSTMRFTE